MRFSATRRRRLRNSKGQARGSAVNSITRAFASRTDVLQEVRSLILKAAAAFGFDEEESSRIALAVDEACTNVIKHAYGLNPNRSFTVTVTGSGGKFEVVVQDQGRSFNPADIKKLDVVQHLRQYKRGGLGVHLMRTLMDEVEYTSGGQNGNFVRLVKYLRRNLSSRSVS